MLLDFGSRVRGDKDCVSCKGKGVVDIGGGKKRECLCVLRGRVREYLTPFYEKATYLKNMNVSGAVSKLDILIQKESVGLFKAVFKSYLLSHGMVKSHKTLSGFEVMNAYLNKEDGGSYPRLFEVEVLVLYLVGDPNNREYSPVLCSLLESRKSRGKQTWVYCSNDVKSEWFRCLYGVGFSDYLVRDKAFFHLDLSNKGKVE